MGILSHDCKKSNLYYRAKPLVPDEEIVISGISGRFPNSRNLKEYGENLYGKIDMVDDLETRWRHSNVEVPKRMGKISDLNKLDHTCFEISYKQAHTMDPQMRLLLEHAYEAILDAGLNPTALRGTNTGVFIGSCLSESEKAWYYDRQVPNGMGLLGCCRSILASRVAHTFGLNGPCHILDTACSSSMFALDCGFHAIRSGTCDAVLVAGANIILHPYVTLQFARLGVLASDGFCRPFDKNASGYTRSEAVSVILLQKIKDAKRSYSSIVYTKTNCDGYKPQGVTYPSGEMQARLLTEFYSEINMDPRLIDYIEAHSTGTLVGDPEECNALDKVFCTGRDKPIPVGSVKSNVGHSEASAGMCSIAKIILTYFNNVIPPNINYNGCRPGIKSLEEGRLKVVTECMPLEGPLICVNSFGFGGANAHALFKNNETVKVNGGSPTDLIPRLVLWSGRTFESIDSILDDVESRPMDAEFVALLHNIQKDTIPINKYRGFGVYEHRNGVNAIRLYRECTLYSGVKRPVAWIFCGLGAEWKHIDLLMTIPIFEKAIWTCHKLLLNKGLDLIKILRSCDNSTLLHSITAITAIQIGIVDVLRSIQLKCDLIIGHSIGELACAYADECLTVEQTILCAYTIGEISLHNNKKMKNSKMIIIGMSYRKIRLIIPAGVEIAADNAPDSCIVAGPTELLKVFKESLKKKNISFKPILNTDIAYHSSYVAHLGPRLLDELSQIIPNPLKRSAKWRTSVTSAESNLNKYEHCSGYYFASCLLNPVLFRETVASLPPKSLTLEIGTLGQLQSNLNVTIPNGVHLHLLPDNDENNLTYFITTLGKLFNHGTDMNIADLYPAVKYPVSAKTPMISPLIKWDYNEDWFVLSYETCSTNKSGVTTTSISLTAEEMQYLEGHTIDGRVLYPATGYLLLAWEQLSKMKGLFFFDLPVEFSDVKFLRATAFTKNQDVELTTMLQQGTGQFEITEGSTTVVSGYIHELKNINLPDISEPLINNYPHLKTKDFYKELRLRGYHYGGLFKSVVSARSDGLTGKVHWRNNWVSFMDCLLQMQIIGNDTRNLLLPVGIQNIKINPMQHILMTTSNPEDTIFDVHVSKDMKMLKCGGILMSGIQASPVARRKAPGFPVLETYKFISHLPAPKMNVENAVRVCVQLVLENVPFTKIKAIEVDSADGNVPIINHFQDALGDLPLVTTELTYLTNHKVDLGNIPVLSDVILSHKNCLFVIANKCLSNPKFTESVSNSLSENGFLVSREVEQLNYSNVILPPDFQLLCVIPIENETIVLMQHQKRKITGNPSVIKISQNDQEYTWISEVRTAMKNGPVLLVAENDKNSGLIGLVNCLRKEPDGLLVKCVFIDDVNAPKFKMEEKLYKDYLRLGLAINVYRNGSWGSYRHLQLTGEYESQRSITHSYVNALIPGDLSSLKWLQGTFNLSSNTDKYVRVVYASLNFRDVMLATGKITADIFGSGRIDQECVLGLEYSGYGMNGERVMGMVEAGALGTHATYDESLAWICPDNWTLEEAATVPVVYGTVYAAFFCSTRISKGKSVLIHAGSGGVGLAAIRVALAYGLDVYTTVSTEEKKKFLLETFPDLNESHIGNSRSISFENMIMIQTEGRGVDFVLNSLADDKLQASVRCLGRGGVFLEIGKFDMANDSKLALSNFEEGKTFCAVLVDNYFRASKEAKLKLRDLVQRDIQRGLIKPLKTNVFPANEVEQAFRYLASGKHVGKVLLKIRENDEDNASLPIAIRPRVYCKPELSYIIPGGLGGFGLELADWIVIRGCRKLVLSSSRGITKQYQSHRIRTWEQYGAKVVVSTSDISTRLGCEELIREAKKLGPVGGIFNLAVALRDAIFENQDAQKFKECMAPKAIATHHLDELSRKMCPELHHFVIFSSVSCGRGNAGQTNYGMANSVMERIMERRHADGFPAKAIQWGAVGEVGLVADMAEDKLDMEIGGTLQQRISSCLYELDLLISTPDPIVSSMVVAEKRSRSDGKGNIIETVMNIMSIRDIKSISMDTTLSELGMDSLMAVEIKQTLERDFDLVLSPQDLRSLTFLKLQEFSDIIASAGTDNVAIKLSAAEVDTGISMWLRNLGDEQDSDQTVLALNNLAKSKSFHTSVIMIPGIEGVAGVVWKTIASSIKHPAFMLQLTNNLDQTNEADFKKFVLKEIKEKVIKKDKKFILIGYSFGCLMTLEIARILEKSGMSGIVIFIDGSPVFLKQLGNTQLGSETSDETLQLMLIILVIRMIFPEENEDIIRVITSCPTRDERIKKLWEFSKDHNIYSEEYIRKMIIAVSSRMKTVCSLNISMIKPIQSSITLIRPTESSITDIAEDYDLTKFTEGDVDLKFIEGNHSTMLDNKKLVDIINNLGSI